MRFDCVSLVNVSHRVPPRLCECTSTPNWRELAPLSPVAASTELTMSSSRGIRKVNNVKGRGCGHSIYMYMYINPCGSQSWTVLMRLETAVRSMPFCSGPPDFFMYMCISFLSISPFRLSFTLLLTPLMLQILFPPFPLITLTPSPLSPTSQAQQY